MKAIRHTQDSLKLMYFLEKYPYQWNSLNKDKQSQKAIQRLQELYGPKVFEYDGFTNQMRFVPYQLVA